MLNNSNDLLGTTLGTCTLKRLIGHGGMGAVYLAQQSRPRRTVAVKVLLADLVIDQRSRDEFLTRFRREADAIAALDHINIMPIYEYGEQGDTAYLVMPYVTGGTLREVLEKNGQLSLERTLTIMDQAAAGLDSAHEQDIIHRDLKPGNMLFHADGRLLLADFGLAKVLRDVESESKGRFLTSIGAIVGTPEYLSPEQSTGQPVDCRTDIYSLGIVLYHMLAGQVPFRGPSPVAVAIKHTLEMPAPLRQFNAEVNADIEAVVMKAIAKAPEQRYDSASELVQALHEAIAGISSVGYIIPAPHDLHPKQDETDTSEEPMAIVPETEPGPHEAATEAVQRVTDKQEDLETLVTAPKTILSDNELYAAPTEEAPRVLPPGEEAGVLTTVIMAQNAMVNPPPDLPRPGREKSEQVQVKEHKQLSQRAAARLGCQSVSMMLIGSLLTLLLVVGGFAAYLKFTPTGGNQTPKSQVQHHQQPTPVVATKAIPPPTHQTPTSQAVNVQLPTPPTGVPGVGAMIYGTALPGPSCDQQGGQWKNMANTQTSCGPSSMQVVGTDTVGNKKSGTFLSGLSAGKQMPNDYMIQVQVDVNAASQGSFGIFFRDQGGDGQGAYAYVINQANKNWGAYVYDGTGNGQIFSSGTHPLQSTLQGTLTFDVIVRGSSFNFYINGTPEGNAESGGQYTNGVPGLAAGPGANVAFKNLEIYALS